MLGLGSSGFKIESSLCGSGFRALRAWGSHGGTQRAQYPLIKEYGLNYLGLHIMI